MLLQQGHDLVHGDCADHDEARVVGTQPVVLERDQVVARQRSHGFLGAGAGERDAVGMIVAVQQRRQHPVGDGLRPGLFLRNACQPLPAHALDVLVVKSRPQHDIREQAQRGIEAILEGIERHVRAVEPVTGADERALGLDGRRQRQRVALARALVQHAHGEAGGAKLPPGVGGIAGVEHQLQLHHGDFMALGEHHLDTIAQPGPLQRRKADLRKLRDLGHAQAAVHLAGHGREGRERRDHQGVVALREAAVADRLDVARGDGLDPFELLAEAARVAGVHGAGGQHVGLAAEAADALHAAHEARAELGLGLRQLGTGRAALEQAGEFLVDDRFDPRRVDAFLDRGGDHEDAGDLEIHVKGGDAGDELFLVRQAGVEARGGAAAEQLPEHRELRRLDRADRVGVPGAVDAGLRDAVVHQLAGGLAARSDPFLGAGERRSGRDVAEIAGDFLARGGDVDVAGQHQHGVVRAVPGLEPVLHVVQRGRVEVGHGADGHPRVGMALGKTGLEDALPGAAIGLVVALPLLVLYHAALPVEQLLGDGTEEVAHAVRFHPQRQVERGGRHVLEIVGAVEAGGAVDAGGADQLEGLEILARVVLGAREHQVLEQVREAGAALGLILGADVVPEIHGDDRRLAIGVHDHPEPVVEREFLEGDVDGVAGARGERQGDGQGEGGEQPGEPVFHGNTL